MTHELTIQSPSVIGELARSEINQAIATARMYPRDPAAFERRALTLATGTKEAAADCNYALPIEGKLVEGPSARFAEIIASTWGNCRAGARVIEEAQEYLTAQGVFHDLEANSTTTFETRRRLIDKKGRRYSPHMVITTANAACSIALRQAVLKGVPKPYWSPIYDTARRIAAGDEKGLPEARKKALAAFKKYKISDERLFNAVEVTSVDELGLDEITKLRGLFMAIRDGELSPEEAFPPPFEKKPAGAKATTIDEFAAAEDEAMPPKGTKMTTPPYGTQPTPPDVASAAEAYELGRQAHARHASRLQWPGNWKDQANIEAWLTGWDSAKEDDGMAGAET
jgi:hypothetical protein